MYLITFLEIQLSFVSFLIVSLTTFISKHDTLRDSTIFMISSIPSFEIVSAVVPDRKILFWIAASVADTAAVNLAAVNSMLLLSKRF